MDISGSPNKLAYHPRLVASASILSVTAASFSNAGLFSIMLPMQHQLGFNLIMLLMIILSFHVIESSLFIFSGRLAEKFRFLNIYLLGVLLSLLGLILISCANSGSLVLIGRIMGGFGNAFAITNSIALIKITLPQTQQNKVMSIWLGCATLAFALGPLIGGLADLLSTWRLLYWITIGIDILALGCILLGFKAVPNDRNPSISLDVIGNLFFMLTIICFILFFSLSTILDWHQPDILFLLVLACFLLIIFIFYERFARHPILDFSLFKKINYFAAAINAFSAGGCLFGSLYFYNLFAQNTNGLHFMAWLAGLSLLPLNLIVFILSLFANTFMQKINHRWLFILGSGLTAIGLLSFYWLTPPIHYPALWWRLSLTGLGLGFTFPLVLPLGMQTLSAEKAGVGSGWINFFVMFGASLSIPLGQIVYLHRALSRLTHSNAWLSLPLTMKHLIKTSLTSAHLPISHSKAWLHPIVTHSFSSAMLVLFLFALPGLIISLWIKNKTNLAN